MKASKVFELVNQVLSPLSQLTLKFDVVITDGSVSSVFTIIIFLNQIEQTILNMYFVILGSILWSMRDV